MNDAADTTPASEHAPGQNQAAVIAGVGLVRQRERLLGTLIRVEHRKVEGDHLVIRHVLGCACASRCERKRTRRADAGHERARTLAAAILPEISHAGCVTPFSTTSEPPGWVPTQNPSRGFATTTIAWWSKRDDQIGRPPCEASYQTRQREQRRQPPHCKDAMETRTGSCEIASRDRDSASVCTILLCANLCETAEPAGRNEWALTLARMGPAAVFLLYDFGRSHCTLLAAVKSSGRVAWRNQKSVFERFCTERRHRLHC